MSDLRLQCLQRRLGFMQGPFGALTGRGFRRQRGFNALQAAGGRAGLPGAGMSSAGMRCVRHVAPHNRHRNFAILHEAPPVYAALNERATASALPGLRPFALGARSWTITMQTERTTHLLFGVIHRRRGRGGLRLFPRQAHALTLVRMWF
jgi:hypothetical protein